MIFTFQCLHQRSANKSILNALFGIRVKQGKISLNDKVNLTYWKDLPFDSAKKSITIDQLLRMSSGLKFKETYDPLGNTHKYQHLIFIGDPPKMLFSTYDHAEFASSFELIHSPDTFWSYSSGRF